MAKKISNEGLIAYSLKKNHEQIYAEFLHFQSLESSKESDATNTKTKNTVIPNEKFLNIRNFQALYWIALYLKEIKGNFLTLVHEFFIYKNWVTWSFRNFSYHYYKLTKSAKIRDELEQLRSYLLQEESSLYGQAPNREISSNKISVKQNAPRHKPQIMGNYSSTGNSAINLNSSLEESQERLRLARENIKKQSQ